MKFEPGIHNDLPQKTQIAKPGFGRKKTDDPIFTSFGNFSPKKPKLLQTISKNYETWSKP
jgi:hypothetical protein